MAQTAASIPGTVPWPTWNPFTEPWPQGKLPFDIQDLRIECSDQRALLRHLVDRGAGHRPEDDRWAWVFANDSKPADKKCQHTEKSQGLRPKPGPNPEKTLEKKPIEFLECVGHRLRLADCPNIGFAELNAIFSTFDSPVPTAGQTAIKPWSPDVTLTDTNGAHGAGFIVCSDCANRSYVNRNYCLWNHDRMIPLCRDCCETPNRTNALSYQYDSSRLSIRDNILKFNRGEPGFFECNCSAAHSPANGFHLCFKCSSTLDAFYYMHLYHMMRVDLSPSTERTEVYEARSDNPLRLGRNLCVCGKSWEELLASWIPLSHEERERKMYRLCFLCTGHIPTKKILTAMRTNCI